MSELQVLFFVLYSALLVVPVLAGWDNRRQLRRAVVRLTTRRAR